MKYYLCSNLKSSFFLLFLSGSLISACLYMITFHNVFLVEVEIKNCGLLGLSFPLVFDSVSLMFSSVVIFISGSVMMFSSFYMESEEFSSRFVSLVVLFVVSMNLLIYVPSMFGLMVGWDGLGVISFLLVIYYQNNSSLGAGMITVLSNRVGDVLFIVAIGLLSGTSSFSFIDISEWSVVLMVIGLIIVGSMTKSAQIPFSAWLPAAMAAPTPVSALVHSSTLVTAGVYVLVRFSSSMWESWGLFLFIMALLTVVMAGASASFEADLKKIIALSTLSQLGMMMLVISVGCMSICVFHLMTHALFKALMFMCAGAVIHLSGGVQDIRCFSGMWFKLPIISAWLIVSCCSLMGIPFMAGFYSKDLILELCLLEGVWGGVFLLLSLTTLLTAFYSIRFICLMLLQQEYSSFSNFNNLNLPLVFSSSFLGVGAIFSGAVFQEILTDTNLFIFLPQSEKLSIPFMVFTGAVLSFFYFNFSLKSGFYHLMNEKGDIFYLLIKWLKSFNSKMWFLPMLSGFYWSNNFLLMETKVLVSLENGWVEGGVREAYSSYFNFSKALSKMQSNILGVFFFVSAVSLILLSLNLF